ncbi:MAG TPA: septal ring lytic transglycosylase RlpA family protein [Candidatus Binataceae bacterium]|nr:septal ring lytic transglycosylase RlpA family protein [Candidatus Binataceae bacterium]
MTTRRWIWLAMVVCVTAAGCAAQQPAPSVTSAPGAPTPGAIRSVVGKASWYGPGFDGHPTATGEIYNQDQMTAASSIFPLGARVIVTDLGSGRAVEVRINDRGPFRKGRKIDLSYCAARALGMVGPGTALVRMDLISTPEVDPAGVPQFFVQAGSYADESNAENIRVRLAAYYPDVRLSELDTAGRRYYRVRMGGFATREQAQARAAATARFGLPVIIVSE